MATNREALNQQLQQIVNSLKEQGILDNQFGIVHSLKEYNSPFFLAEMIPMFSQNVQTILRDLTRTLIGARRMALACVTLRQAVDNKNKDGCDSALNGMRHEYQNLQSSLDIILELERRIVSHQA
eukprot:XP_019079562.1 PREDICTED: histidine-containing phosphotransfer protein 5 isoform X2 [Vitis vinifera]